MRTAFIYLMTIITISCNSLSNSDPSHFKTTLVPGLFNQFNVVLQTEDGGYVAAGALTTTDDPNYTTLPTEVLIAKMDKFGNTTKETQFSFSSNDVIKKGIKLTGGNILLLGSTVNNNNEQALLSIFIDANADTISTHTFGEPTFTDIAHIIEYGDGTIWVLANQAVDQLSPTAIKTFCIYKLSLSGELLSVVKYDAPVNSTAFYVEPNIEKMAVVYGNMIDTTGKPKAVYYTSVGDLINLEGNFGIGSQELSYILNFGKGQIIDISKIKGNSITVGHYNRPDPILNTINFKDRTDLITAKVYSDSLYLLGLMTTRTASKYYQYKLELRSIVNDSVVWSTNNTLAESTIMMYDVTVTADSGFAVVGMQDVPGKGSEAFIHKLPKPDVFVTRDAF